MSKDRFTFTWPTEKNRCFFCMKEQGWGQNPLSQYFPRDVLRNSNQYCLKCFQKERKQRSLTVGLLRAFHMAKPNHFPAAPPVSHRSLSHHPLPAELCMCCLLISPWFCPWPFLSILNTAVRGVILYDTSRFMLLLLKAPSVFPSRSR